VDGLGRLTEVNTHIHAQVYTHIHIYTHIHTYTYIHTHTHTKEENEEYEDWGVFEDLDAADHAGERGDDIYQGDIGDYKEGGHLD
jgi:hypothetical protein